MDIFWNIKHYLFGIKQRIHMVLNKAYKNQEGQEVLYLHSLGLLKVSTLEP